MTNTRKNVYIAALIVLVICLIVIGSCVTRSRAQKPEPKPDPQAEFKAAQKRLSEALTALAPYQQAYAAALAERDASLFKLMAEASMKPSQCAVDGNQFACAKVDPKTGDVSFVPKPSPSP